MDVARCMRHPEGSAEAEYNSEYRVIWPKDGSIHFLRSRGKVFRDARGQAIRLTGACWDITERKTIEEELARERFLLRTLMEHIPDKIYFKDAASRFIWISQETLARFGSNNPADVLGKTDFDFFKQEHARQAYEDEQKIIRTGEPLVNLEERETWADGRETWVSTTKMPLVDATGNIIGTFGLSRDITEHKRAEEQLANYAEELRRKNQDLEEDLEMARELQNALMPQRYPCFPRHAAPSESALRFAHFFNPSSSVSGDFFDILRLSDTSGGIFICDVMGHGVRAALVAAIIRALITELKNSASNPGEFLSHLNRKLCGILQQTRIPMFASAAYVIGDIERGELRYANAGHPEPLCLHRKNREAARREPGTPAAMADARDRGASSSRAGAKAASPVVAVTSAHTTPLHASTRGPVLGIFEGAQYPTAQSDVSAGDLVLLFTDGVFEVESEKGALYDEKMLTDAINRRADERSVDQLLRDVLAEVQEFSANKQFTDDVCFVAMEIAGAGGGRSGGPPSVAP
jgi:sigma-B regulation protein RsbU (phosphoserine phosphatase)